MAKQTKTELVEIKPIETVEVKIAIEGTTPLIVHAWSEKAKRMMLEAQQGRLKGKKRDVRNPVEDFVNSLYWLTPKPSEYTMEAFEAAVESGARFGFPVKAVKDAAVSAAYRNGWTKDKVSAKGSFFLKGTGGSTEFVEVLAPEPPAMREDMVHVSLSTDLRYRGEFREWRMEFVLSYNKNGQYSLDNLLTMLNAGGYSCGIGEWRPEKGGTSGMFKVVTA